MAVASAVQASGTKRLGAKKKNKNKKKKSSLLSCTYTCRLWIQSTRVYTASPPETSLVYRQKAANLGHPISPCLQILMSSDTVCAAKC